MKKTLVLSVSALLLLSSCGSYAGMGAYTGGSFGSIIGSAIGGIAGGHRGSDIGTLIGMAGGAAVGAAVGAAADNAERQRYEEYRAQREQRVTDRTQYNRGFQNDSGFDATNSGDDRLYGFGEDFSSKVVDSTPSSLSCLEIRNPKIIDTTRDGVLSRGEEARMVFEIFNISDKPVYRVMPSVAEITGNKHIRVSENVLVESIMPGRGIRYTAVIKADDHLRDGDAVFRIGVFQSNKEIISQSREFPMRTSKR